MDYCYVHILPNWLYNSLVFNIAWKIHSNQIHSRMFTTRALGLTLLMGMGEGNLSRWTLTITFQNCGWQTLLLYRYLCLCAMEYCFVPVFIETAKFRIIRNRRTTYIYLHRDCIGIIQDYWKISIYSITKMYRGTSLYSKWSSLTYFR